MEFAVFVFRLYTECISLGLPSLLYFMVFNYDY